MKTLSGIWLLTKQSYKISPFTLAISILETLSRVVSNLYPLFLGALIASAIAGDFPGALIWVGLLAFSLSVPGLLELIGTTARVRLLETLGNYFDARVATMTSAMPTLEHFETPEFLDRYQQLRDQKGTMGLTFNYLLNLLNMTASTITVLAVALATDWRLIFVALAGFLSLLLVPISLKFDARADKESGAGSRLVDHLLSTTGASDAGSELRVFAARDDVQSRLKQATRAWRRPWIRAEAGKGLANAILTAFIMVSAVIVIAFIAQDVSAGIIGVATLATSLTLIERLQNVGQGMSNMISGFARSIQVVGHFQWLDDFAKSKSWPGESETPHALSRGLTLKNMSFSYPGAEHASLKNINAHIPAGSFVAIVGENGSGKTTLTALLQGLYEPTAGEIQLEGKPLSSYRLELLRERMSATFQDHVNLEFSAREDIRYGDLSLDRDSDGTATQLERAATTAGADTVVNALPRGYETQLGLRFSDESGNKGQDLSGGQWQRLALARGFVREEPLLTILDEPTSALDASAEQDLFDRYAQRAREGKVRGAITIVVTHRFSTVRQADLVLVLNHGVLTGIGTHEELMAKDAHYAHLYELQAGGYR